MPDMWKFSNYFIMVAILAAAVYFVIFDTNRQITERQEVDLKDRVAQNAQYPQLVAGGIGKNSLYRGQRICPAGSAQLASSDHDCNFCHKITDGLNKFSDATHEYSFIAGAKAGNQTAVQFPEPVMPGYTAEPFPDPALPGRNIAGPPATPLKPANTENTVQMTKDPGTMLTGNAPPIRWGVKRAHPKRGVCTNCHALL